MYGVIECDNCRNLVCHVVVNGLMDQQTVNKLQNGNYLGKQQWGWYNTISINNVLIAR